MSSVIPGDKEKVLDMVYIVGEVIDRKVPYSDEELRVIGQDIFNDQVERDREVFSPIFFVRSSKSNKWRTL